MTNTFTFSMVTISPDGTTPLTGRWLNSGGVDGLGKEGIASSHRALFSVRLRTSWRISFS